MIKKLRAISEAALLVGLAYLVYEIMFLIYNYLVYEAIQEGYQWINIDRYKNLSSYEEVALKYTGEHPLEYTVLCWVVIALILLVLLLPTKQNFVEMFSFRRLSLGNGLASVFAGLGLVFMINGALRYTSAVSDLNIDYLSGDIFQVYNLLYLMGIVGIITPIFEELFFRGVLLSRLGIGFGAMTSVVFSSFLFSVSHLNVIQGIYVFPVGLLAAYLVLTTGSIFAGIWLHMIYNMVNVYLAKIEFFQYNSLQLLVMTFLGIVLLAFGLYQVRGNPMESDIE